jgi:hypothetical protein
VRAAAHLDECGALTRRRPGPGANPATVWVFSTPSLSMTDPTPRDKMFSVKGPFPGPARANR